jgi:hypothetical protein
MVLINGRKIGLGSVSGSLAENGFAPSFTLVHFLGSLRKDDRLGLFLRLLVRV